MMKMKGCKIKLYTQLYGAINEIKMCPEHDLLLIYINIAALFGEFKI